MNLKLSLIFLVFGAVSAFAADFTSNGVAYSSVNDTQAKVTGLSSGFSGALIIPEKVNDYAVTSIDSKAFQNNSQITSVVIPSSVRNIGSYAFSGCTSLYKAEINAAITIINSYTFYGCTGLSSVVLPSSITTIGESAFENCSALRNITFPEKLTTFGTHAFKNSGLTTAVFPDGVTTFGTWSFESCKSLQYMKLPTTATAIAEGTFYNCTSLKFVTIPANFKTWGNNAFNYCHGLQRVYYLGMSKPEVSQYTFARCSPSLGIYVKSAAYSAVKQMNFFGDCVSTEIPLQLTADMVPFSADYDVDFSKAEGLTAYIAKSYDDTKSCVAMTAVTEAKAGTGLILKGKAGSTYTLTISASSPNAFDNLLLAALSPQTIEKSDAADPGTAKPAPIYKGSLSLSLDKSFYAPGEEVTLFYVGERPTGLKVRYMKGASVIESVDVNASPWKWRAPLNDFTGYMAVAYTQDDNNVETIYGTIGIDVSSDWTRFPRYGFVSDYGYAKTPTVVNTEAAKLARYHMNGIQFYDWHNKHHWPLGGTRENLLTSYQDIANRTVYNSVLKNYINSLHGVGAACMMYNLCYGMLDDAQSDGVDLSWGAYTDANHTNLDCHKLSSSWKSNIYLVDPSNVNWQNYLAQRNDDVYANLNFDGFHIDQLGSRATLYNYSGSTINLPAGMNAFVRAMKKAHPTKKYAFNAVSCYGGDEIITSESVDFAYDELWDAHANFSDLHDVIENNYEVSGRRLHTVIAGYMDYNKANSINTFNTPGVLLTDATIFALGGAHLELSGDHMLCTEYFPNANCKMSTALSSSITCYYDFLTAYENLLRDGGQEVSTTISSAGATLNVWPPKLGTVTSFSRQFPDKLVVNLLNYSQANSLSWRDMDGSQPEPTEMANLNLTLQIGRPVARIWAASPDYLGGMPVELNFSQSGSDVKLALPNLKYWTMLVVEYVAESKPSLSDVDYTFVAQQFTNVSDSRIYGEEAFLRIPSGLVSDTSKTVCLDFGTTGIRNVKSGIRTKNGYVYDLLGRRIGNDTNGICILNGQKVLKK
jgi:dextranase